MKKWFSELTNAFKTAFVSRFIVIIAFLATTFGYFVNMSDIPNGIIAGGLIGSVSYLFMGLAEKHDAKNVKATWTIIVSIIRYFLIGSFIVVAALIQYNLGYKIFNLFAVVGGYLISLATYVIILLMEKKNV